MRDIPITVGDFLENRKKASFSFHEVMYHNRMIALDAGTGKQVFDTGNNKAEFVKKFFPANILDIWVEMRERIKPVGFGPYIYEPVIVCYIEHDSWNRTTNPEVIGEDDIITVVSKLKKDAEFSVKYASQNADEYKKVKEHEANVLAHVLDICVSYFHNGEEPAPEETENG